jgi:predicted phosphodiesterase
MNTRKLIAVCTTVLLICLASFGGGSPTGSTPLQADEFRKSPYLIYNGNNTQMVVLWQTTVTETATISWGIDTSYRSGTESVNERSSDHIYRHILTGLTPGQKYYYRVELSNRNAAGSFVAAPVENGPATLFLYGDTRTNPVEHDRLAAEMISSYSANPALQGLVLHAGDLVTDGDEMHDWDSELFSPLHLNLSRFLSEVPLQAVRGNHEGKGVLYATFFPYHFLKSCYWSFDYGVVHVTVVDQYSIPGGGISSEQLVWIASDLAATTKPWKIILLHEPGWSAGAHPNNVSVQLKIQPLAKRYGAMVIAGHNHYYARAVVDGVNHITTGGGGAPLYTPVLPSPQVVIAEKTYHFCTIEASENTLLFKAVRADGSHIETFKLTR